MRFCLCRLWLRFNRIDFFRGEVGRKDNFEHLDVFAVPELAMPNLGRLVHA